MLTLDVLKSALGQFFRDNFYTEAIVNLRLSLKEESVYQKKWEDIIKLILNKDLEPRIPLDLIHNTANLPLYENSDEEAYRWLILMLINAAGSEGDPIMDYKELFKPEKASTKR